MKTSTISVCALAVSICALAYAGVVATQANAEHQRVLTQVHAIQNTPVSAGAMTSVVKDGQTYFQRCTNQGWCYSSAHKVDLSDEQILPRQSTKKNTGGGIATVDVAAIAAQIEQAK